MFQDISIQEFQTSEKFKNAVLIDVRSPSEFEAATIPNAINIPVFTDAERAEIGTIYKQVSVEAAKERGLEIFSAKLPQFIKEFKKIQGDKVVFCWRGGMRSRTAATVVDLIGIPIFRLAGGIRAHREFIKNQLENFVYKPNAFVLNGYTGSGKTKILQALKNEGFPILNLEEMANHRGSIFGQIGLKPHNQRMFDALLYNELLKTEDAKYVLFEGESKRIGKAVLPPFFIDKKDTGTQIFIYLPMEERIKTILEDYYPWEHQEECFEAFQKIKRHIHTPIALDIEKYILAGEFSLAIRLLLEYYYDPLYDYSANQYTADEKIVIEALTVEDATDQIRELLCNYSS